MCWEACFSLFDSHKLGINVGKILKKEEKVSNNRMLPVLHAEDQTCSYFVSDILK